MALDDSAPQISPDILNAIQQAQPRWVRDGLGVRGNPMVQNTSSPGYSGGYGNRESTTQLDPQVTDYSGSLKTPEPLAISSPISSGDSYPFPFALSIGQDDNGDNIIIVSYGEVDGYPPSEMVEGEIFTLPLEGDTTYVYLQIPFDSETSEIGNNITLETSGEDPNAQDTGTDRNILVGQVYADSMGQLQTLNYISSNVYTDKALYVDNSNDNTDTAYFFADSQDVWVRRGPSGSEVSFHVEANDEGQEVTVTLDNGQNAASRLDTSSLFIGSLDDKGDIDPEYPNFDLDVDTKGGEVTVTMDNGKSAASELTTSSLFIGHLDDAGEHDPDKPNFDLDVDTNGGEVTVTMDNGKSAASELTTSSLFIGSLDGSGEHDPDKPNFDLDVDTNGGEVTVTMDNGKSAASELTTSSLFIGSLDSSGEHDPDKPNFDLDVDTNGGDVTLILDDGSSSAAKLTTSELFIGSLDSGGETDPDKPNLNIDVTDGEVSVALDDGNSSGAKLTTSELFIGQLGNDGTPNQDQPNATIDVNSDGGEVTITLDDGSNNTTTINTSSIQVEADDNSGMSYDSADGEIMVYGSDSTSVTINDQPYIEITDGDANMKLEADAITIDEDKFEPVEVTLCDKDGNQKTYKILASPVQKS
jgi:proline racemase